MIDSLSGDGDIHYYKFPVYAGQRVFVLLDKNYKFSSFLTLKEAEFPEREGNDDQGDQAAELLPKATGFCYARIEFHKNSNEEADKGIFRITVHNETTFPKIQVGQTLTGQKLTMPGDSKWFQVKVQEGHRVFALLNKESQFSADLTIEQYDLISNSSQDYSDQAVTLIPQGTGYCYIKVSLIPDYFGVINSGTFSLSAYDNSTFPRLTMGQVLAGQNFTRYGEKKWYQITVNTFTPLVVQVYPENLDVSLMIEKDSLPVEELVPSKSHTFYSECAAIIASEGNYYVEVRSRTDGNSSYSILADQDLKKARNIVIDDSIIHAEYSADRGCITSLIYKNGSNAELLNQAYDYHLFDFGRRDPVFGQILLTGWQIHSSEIKSNLINFSLVHPSGFRNKLSLSWDTINAEVRSDIDAPSEVAICNSVIPAHGYSEASDKWAVVDENGFRSDTFTDQSNQAILYPSADPSDWASPYGWVAFWNESADEVYGFTFSTGNQLQIEYNLTPVFNFRIPEGSSTIVFHIIKHKPSKPYDAIQKVACGPELILPSIVPVNSTVSPKMVLKNAGLETATFSSQIMVHTIYADSRDDITLLPGKTDTVTFNTWQPTEAAAYKIKYQSKNSKNKFPDIKTAIVSVSKGTGPEIYSLQPAIAFNGSNASIRINGSGFVNGTTARLKCEGKKDISASSVKFVSANEIVAKFDLINSTESDWNFIVSNPDGNNFTFYNGLRTYEFRGQRLTFNKWEVFDVEQNTAIQAGVTVPQGIENLFVLLKKSKPLGYSGTWNGGIRIFKDDLMVGQASGQEDFALSIRKPEPGWYYIEIWSSDPGNGKINVCSALDTLKNQTWNKGIILRPYGSDWMQTDVPDGQQNLFFETEGVGLWSILDIYLDSINNLTDHWQFSNMGEGYHITGSIKNPKKGRYYLKYTDSGVLYGTDSQVRQYMIIANNQPINEIAPLQPRIDTLSTYKVAQGPVTFKVYGTGLDSSSVCALVSAKGDTTFALSRRVDKSTSVYTASFDLSVADTGKYSFYYKNSKNGLFCTAYEKVEIISYEEQTLSLSVLSRDNIRIDRYQSVIVKVHNKSNSDALAVPLIITIPKICEFKVENLGKVKYVQGDPLNPNDIAIEVENHLDSKYIDIPLIISRINANDFFEVRFKIKTESFEDVRIQIKVDRPVPSSDNINSKSKGYVKSDDCEPCYDLFFDILTKVIEEVIPSDMYKCFFDIATTLYSIAHTSNDPNVYSMTQTIAEALNTLQTCAKAGANTIPVTRLLKYLIAIAQYAETSKNLFDCIRNCENKEEGYYDEYEKKLPVTTSSTPEDKYSSAGYDLKTQSKTNLSHFVNNGNPLTYRIDFWNKETATAPAQEVFIWDTLDTDLNDKTLAFTELGFLRWKVKLEGGHYFNVNVDMRPDMNLIVNAEGKYDQDTREIKYTFRSLDPATMELTEDPQAGFLPAIDTSGYQLGWVMYDVTPNSTLTTGSEITNRAWVNFDGVGTTNPAPKDAPWLNTIDAVAPESEVNPLITQSSSGKYLVTWDGSDDPGGSGILKYTVYVSSDNGPFAAWITNTAEKSAEFTAESGHLFTFYSVATDGAGNAEAAPKGYDAILMTTSANELKDELPSALDLKAAPNPFEKQTELSYSLPERGNVEFRIVNMTGVLLKVVTLPGQDCGKHTFALRSEATGSGELFVQMNFNGETMNLYETIRVIRLR